MKRNEKGQFVSKVHTSLIGNKYNRLLVLRDSGKRQNRKVLWECLCDCGNKTLVPGDALKSNNIKSCGCGQLEFYSKKEHNNPTFIDGTEVGLLNPELMFKSNTSGFRGVSQRKSDGKFRAYIQFKKKPYWLGVYTNIEDAVKARKEAEEALFGNFLQWYEKNHKTKER